MFLAIFHCSTSYSQIKNEADVKKQAQQSFEEEDYNTAYKLYAQLVSLYPKDPDYNFKLGVCMLYTEPDKKKPFSYLQIALKNPTEAPKDAMFYLAKTYHINYKFDEAIKYYTEYKKTASASSIKKLQVNREIENCINGKRLLSNLSDLVIVSKKQLNAIDYFRGYDIKDIGGKLLVKPDEYKTGYDKKQKDKSVVYLPKSGERLYYSSYGESGSNGRDIFFVNRLPNGSWSKPQSMPTTINTPYDEDYPFLHPNGKTLYFSSKGHNSMGGYDVFKTTYDAETQSWSKPENLEFPINSPDDDILFVTDSLEKTAFFSTGRYSPYGKLDVLKINTERRPMNFAVIKGTVVKEEASQSLKSKITVKNMANGEIVGTFQAQDNGDYNLELPNGGKFIFTVETPGIPTQSDAVQIPVAYSLKPYKQVVSYEQKKLKIINYFDGAVDEENYAMMLDLIEKKAKLEVNENEPYNNNLLKETSNNQNSSSTNLNSVSTNNPTAQANNASSQNNTNKNVTNEQLLEIAKTDAKEASDEVVKLKQEAKDAFGLATAKTAEAVEKQKEADEAIANANTITDVAKKNEAITKVNQLKEEAKIANNVAETATNLAKKLEVDASQQQKEADLTNQYISQLEAVTKNKNNTEALKKLEEIQKELDNLSKQKNQSDELFVSLKAEAELKQQEITNTEKKNNAVQNEINLLKNESESLEKDLANESDKTLKENISAQIREVKNEIDLKNKEVTTNQKTIESLNNEINGINQELLVAAKILNESTDGIAVTDNSNFGQNNTNITNNESVAINSNTNTNSVSNSSAINSNQNTSNTNANSTSNINSTATNVTVINSNTPISSKATNNLATDNEPIKTLTATNTNNPTALLTEISSVKESLTANSNASNDILTYNNYKENTSVTLKESVTKKMETVKENELTLSNLISNTESSLKNPTNTSPENLLNDAELLNDKAYEIRKQAATKTGPEKENLINQALEDEKKSITKKLEASSLAQLQNKANFDNNTVNLNELQKLTSEKTSDDISRANMLSDEANINFKQAQKMRVEAESYPDGAAKLSGLISAEDKEKEALAKQQAALTILSKINPSYQIKPLNAETVTPASINKINEQIQKTASAQVDAYQTLSNANENELKLQSSLLINNPAYKSPENTEAQNLKSESDNLTNEAKQLLTQANSKTSNTEKADLLLKANEKEIEALKKLNQASNLIEKNPVATNNQNTNNNTSVNKTTNNTEPETNTSVANNVTSNNTDLNASSNNNVNSNEIKTDSNGGGDKPSNLKKELNNPTETNLTTFNNYSNTEAATLKQKALEKINLALSEDKKLSSDIDQANQLQNNTTNTITPASISAQLSEADQLSAQASALRKSAASKTGPEKEIDLANAKQLEAAALSIKIEAANNQQTLNENTYKINQQNLEGLQALAKNKNIVALNNAETTMNDANSFIKQAANLRAEANSYPNDAAKLGGYSNAEEKEALAIAKQQELLNTYKMYFPEYVPKTTSTSTESNDATNAKLNQTSNNINVNNQTHIEGLYLLTQANELEIKERIKNLPSQETPQQTALKTKAQTSYNKQTELINLANQTNDNNKKKNLLIEANQFGQEAINTLVQLTEPAIAVNSSNQTDGNNNTNKNTSSPSNSTNNTNANKASNNTTTSNTNNPKANANSVKLSVEGLEIKNTNAYSSEKPIPIDEKIPDGLVFKVQIGAFKTPLPNNTFKGISPILAQRTPSGYIRYMAGSFEKYVSANAVKNDLRSLGYSDAFVVAYYNGVRITLNEATEKAKANGQTIETNTNTTAGITTNTNVPQNNIAATTPIVANASIDTQPVEVTNELEKLNGLLYTVQIGVFSKQATRAQLFNLNPIYTEKLPSGLYRYTAGIYNQPSKLIEDKRKVIDLGVKDAFVTAYYNAKRISFTEGQKIQTENSNLKMETENPIVFSSKPVETASVVIIDMNTIAQPNNPSPTPSVTPFSNGVSSGPAPTADNGVKVDDSGISFKVQIGAYKNQVPNDIAAKFLNIKTWPVKNVVINGLFIYTIGNFTSPSYAKKLRDEAVSVGVTDAYITVYKDGKKLYGSEASQYLTQ